MSLSLTLAIFLSGSFVGALALAITLGLAEKSRDIPTKVHEIVSLDVANNKAIIVIHGITYTVPVSELVLYVEQHEIFETV